MSLLFYSGTPFNAATQTTAVDLGVGDGFNTTFPVTNKAGISVGSTVQAGDVEYFRANGGVTISGNNVILSDAPANGVSVVIPGTNSIVFSGFDNDNVPISTPRISTQKIYIANVDNIALQQHTALPGSSGIVVSFVDNIQNVGPDLTWLQLASADNNGSMLTPLSTGQSLTLPAISTYSTLASSVLALASSITVTTASGFTPGSYCLINPGQANQEEVFCTNINYSTNTLYINSQLSYSHTSSENIYHNGWVFYAICTIPSGATNNTAQNYYNIGLSRVCQTSQRP